MHSSRIYTVCCSGHLSCHACPPPTTHTPAMHTPPGHTCPPAMHAATTHPLPHMPPLPCTPPPTVDRMTDACENITFPQLLLRTVIKKSRQFNHSDIAALMLTLSVNGVLRYMMLTANLLLKNLLAKRYVNLKRKLSFFNSDAHTSLHAKSSNKIGCFCWFRE